MEQERNINKEFADMVESLLNSVYETLEIYETLGTSAKSYDSQSVPLSLVKAVHEIAIKGFKKGLEGK
jgi:uncharacterized protein YfbU (UPF0304 family)